MVGMRFNPGTVVNEFDIVKMVPEPENPYDANAIKIINAAGKTCGHLKREHAIEAGALLAVGDIEDRATVCTKWSTSIDIITSEVEGILATMKYVEAHPFPEYDAKYAMSPECFDITKEVYERITHKDEVKALGHALLEAGGHSAMVKTIYLLKHVFKNTIDDVRAAPRLVEMWWHGIGAWQG
jgi:hypothetical protein